MTEPIAVVGISALYPGIRGAAEYWTALTDPNPPPRPPRLDDTEIDLTGFRIPPAQRRSLSRLQLLMLEAARLCLDDAGYLTQPWADARMDVVVGTCFGLNRQYANALRIAGAHYGRDLEQAASTDPDAHTRAAAPRLRRDLRASLVARLGASPHDRVGEMASTIPARIAAAFHLLGRTIALESADATGFVALECAIANLRAGSADAVLVLTGQCLESSLAADALAAKGLFTASPALAEGVTALLLERRSSALRNEHRVYASVLGCALRHEARPGALRYSTNAEPRYRLAKECHDAAGVPPAAVRYAECAGPGIHSVREADQRALARFFGDAAPASIAWGDTATRLGHTFANAGLAAVSATALALFHGKMPPTGHPGSGSAEASPHESMSDATAARTAPRGDGYETPAAMPFRQVTALEEWPGDPVPPTRHAAVFGCGLGGTSGYVLLGHAVPRRTARRVPAPVRAEPIAVVGYGGIFAGAGDAANLWQAIRSCRSGLGTLSADVLDRELYYAPGEITLTHSYCQVGGSVPPPGHPPGSVRLTPHRYRVMDPAQRLALLVADEALARYGRPEGLRERIGVVAVGSTLSLSTERRINAERSVAEWESALAETPAWADLPGEARARLLDRLRERYPVRGEQLSPVQLDGFLAGAVATMVTNEYRLSAVPLAVEAACASTLAAIDLAVTSLRAGSTDFAMAGGVELACNPRDLVLCSALGMLSRSRITPFDSAADGFSPGDGCALFLLKRHADALRDGDTIYGLIRGIGASNDAKSLIAPDVAGQVRAMRRAFEQVEFDPGAVDYLEAHGTGTRVGDRVEISAAAEVYGGSPRRNPLAIGSVKAVVGHTFAAAGGAGLLAALQAMRANTFPPNIGVRTPNPELPLDNIPAVLPIQPTPWPSEPGRPRRAAVSSFGTGGINYHLLLEEHSRQDRAG
ncbi:polyketide synthase [Nocardia sp. 2]|uniref:Polyketide synthase n=1 Tax=Nocardia acididurans TaxID=2802282 RepID=A0ABS1M5R0_9NOCA|nr:polyketide synthase [Nocardia acididurans]MBL1075896.1 polyketide synthase [Nocardia acididurans]